LIRKVANQFDIQFAISPNCVANCDANPHKYTPDDVVYKRPDGRESIAERKEDINFSGKAAKTEQRVLGDSG